LLKKKGTRVLFSFLCIALFLFLISSVSADEEFKPYLHKAEVPEHPTVKLYGTYSTDLFPGAATYNYQIEVPPGTNGLQPSLSVSYSSQSIKQRPGILGAGWSMPTSYIFRDVNGTVSDTSDDIFKLVFNSANHRLIYNSSDEFYHTEVESYMRIENLSTTANNYSVYWIVTTPDGFRYVLGNDTTSELTSNTGGNFTVRWSLDQVRDTYNNTISYNYSEDPHSEDNGSVYLNKIEYNNEKARVIDFSYEKNARPDMRLTYEQGNALEESRRLVEINVSANGNLIRRYDFDYVDLNPEKSITGIAKISHLAYDGSELHNVTFDYYNTSYGFTKHNATWFPPAFFQTTAAADIGVRLADVNNDGWIDVIRGSDQGDVRTVWINNGSGWFDNSNKWDFPRFFVDANYTEIGVRLADVDNDGLVDVVQSSNSFGNITRSVWLNNGSGWVYASDKWVPPVDFIKDYNDLGVRFIELNGDGYIDIIQSKGAGNVKNVWLNNRSGWTETGNWTPPEFFVVEGNNQDAGLRIADLNSDGLNDLIIFQNFSTYHHRDVWLNNGSGWVNVSKWLPPTSFVHDQNVDAGVRLADINGDGLTDMWQNGKDEEGDANKVWINNGSGWFDSPEWRSPEAFIEAGKNVGRRLADVNGDGMTDIVTSYENATDHERYVWLKNSSTPYALKSIKTELGANITLNYQNLTVYNHTNESGVSLIGFNIFVVSSVLQNNSMDDSFNVLSNITYNYSGGRYDNKAREFRGFAVVEEILSDKTLIKHYFHQDTARKGKENRTEIYDGEGNLYSVQENIYDYTKTGEQFNVFLTSSANYAYDGKANPKITNTTFSYDQYGNLITQHSLGDTSIDGDEKLEVYDYVYNTTAWILNTQSWYRLFASDNITQLREIKYIYDDGIYGSKPSKGSITAIETWLDTGGNHRTESTYGGNGELLTETDPLGRVTKYRYDNTKTFVEQVINPLGHPIRFGYDFGTGNLLWQERNGIKTSFEYDKFGRILKEIQPYDASHYPTKNYTYQFDGMAPESIKVSQRTTANKTSDTFYFYDGFAQLVQIKTASYDNKQSVKNFFYDDLGRIKSEQNPYFSMFSTLLTSPSFETGYINYTYDTLNRVTNVTFPDHTNITVVFEHWNISTFDQNVHQKDYILDSYGRVLEVREYNVDPLLNDGAIYIFNTTYGYDGVDQLIEVVDTFGNNFSFTYDSLGRRTKLRDPDIGEWNHTYDLIGNLISQASGGGNLITGDNFFREYNDLGQLVRIRNNSNVDGVLVEEYYYDPFGDRVKIWHNDSTQTVVYTPFRELMQIRNDSGIFNYSYIYDGSVLVARLNPDGTKQYYHPDHLGSTMLITDESNGLVEETFYEPYGDVTSGGSDEIKLYTGQFSDIATGQYYYGARYYKSDWGRFVQADPVIPDIYVPQSLNRYAYTLNNPYSYVDPTGLEPVTSQTLQVGSFDSVLAHIQSIENDPITQGTASQVLGALLASSFGEQSESGLLSNFVYTSNKGVIDQRHFFTNAHFGSNAFGRTALRQLEKLVELGQCKGLGKHSCNTYEDLVSNELGREFAQTLNDEESLSVQYARFMGKRGVNDFPDWLWDTMPEFENKGVLPPFWKQNFDRNGMALPNGFINPRTEKFVPLKRGEKFNKATGEVEKICRAWRCTK
jgi:RHS repeat-associated protein